MPLVGTQVLAAPLAQLADRSVCSSQHLLCVRVVANLTLDPSVSASRQPLAADTFATRQRLTRRDLYVRCLRVGENLVCLGREGT